MEPINLFMNNLHYSCDAIVPEADTKSLEYSHQMTHILLNSYFSSFSASIKGVLIASPTFKTTFSQGVHVQVFYYDTGNGDDSGIYIPILSEAKIKSLSTAISRLYPHINVELQLVQQHQPYLNASILAQYLAINASKYGFHRIMTLILNAVPYFNNTSFPTSAKSNSIVLPQCITGIKVQLSGLLTTQRNRARKTVYTASAGTFRSNSNPAQNSIFSESSYLGVLNKSYTPNTGNIHIDYAQSTSKSIEGAFNIKVWISSSL